MADTIPYQGTSVIELAELRDHENHVWMDTSNTSSVVATLYQRNADGSAGAAVLGADAIALAFVAKSKHTWRGRLSHSLPVVLGSWYRCKVVATSSDGRQMPFWQDAIVQEWRA